MILDVNDENFRSSSKNRHSGWRVWLTGWSESQTRHAELYCELFSHRFRESSAAAGLVVTAVRGGVVSRSEADVNSSSSSGGAVTDSSRPLTPSTARVVLTREDTAAGGDQPANSVTQGNIPLTVAGSYKPKRKYTFINRKPAAKPRNRGNRPVMSPQASQTNHIVPGTPVSLCTPYYLCWWVWHFELRFYQLLALNQTWNHIEQATNH